MSRSTRVLASQALAPTLLTLASAFAAPSATMAETPRIPAYADHEAVMVVRTPDGQERPVRSLADWNVRRDHILGHLQEVMGPMPGPERRVPLDVQVLETFDEPAYTRKKITFAVETGDRVPAWLLLPKGRTRKVAGILCLHQTIRIGKDEPAGLGGSPNLKYGKELAERGFVSLIPDYPNFGEYVVDPYALGYASASMKAIWNNRRAVDLLASLEEVDPDHLGVIGHSLGGHNSIFTALFEPRLKAVVTSCGFNSFRHYYKGNVAGWSHKGYMPRLRETYGLDLDKIPFDFPELISALAPRGFFTNSPLEDSNFDPEGVRVCIKSATDVYKLHGVVDRLVAEYPAAQHDFPPAQREHAYAFLERLLGKPR